MSPHARFHQTLCPAGRCRLCAGSLQAAEKVIFDTDFNVLNDDGQAFIMLAQLHAQKRIHLLGMTLVSGNAWVDHCPLTNIALAIRSAPDIVPLIKRIVYMGGAIEIPGNTTPAAEFNWWFDPEAAKIVLRSPIEHVIFPNDVCEKVTFDASIYQRVIARPGPIADLYTHEFAPLFSKDPGYHSFTWDSLPALFLVEPGIVTESRELWVDVNAQFGADYGRALGRKIHPWARKKPRWCLPSTRSSSGMIM